MLDLVGKRSIDSTTLAAYNERLKERNLIIEKNKKLRTLKKQEDHVFYMDTLEYNEEAKQYTIYYKEKLRFVNMQENRFDSSIFDTLKECYMRSANISFSMEGSQISYDNILTLRNLYGHRIVL